MPRDALLQRFTQTLPYASEIFGVYQPLLGWKAQSAIDRLNKGLQTEQRSTLDELRTKFKAQYKLSLNQDRYLEDIKPFSTANRDPTPRFDTILMEEVAKRLPPRREYTPAIWDELLAPHTLDHTKFGANVKGEQKWVWGTTNQSASFDLSATQQTAREQAHKRMRQQSDKLATEIRKNYKSTLRVITETTDTSSKRYVLTNGGDRLVNYELRRKMRQVGVQVQDIGTYLCWQTHVDEPGAQLGISELVHIAKKPDFEPQHPEALTRPQPVPVDVPIELSFVQTSEDRGDLDEAYRDGREVDTDFNEGDRETIQADFPQVVSPPQPGYYLDPNILFDKGGADVEVSVRNLVQPDPDGADPITQVSFVVHLNYVNFKGNSPIRIGAKLTWQPRKSLIEKVELDNAARVKEFTEEKAELVRKEYIAAARDRIKLAQKVITRSYEDLREEERIVVYRVLIQKLLTKGIPIKDDATRHAVAELLDSIFDIDKMLYFVAPEWWKPRTHYGQYLAAQPDQAANLPAVKPGFHHLGKIKPPSTTLSNDSLVSWGGAHAKRDDNYYVTEDSLPAKLGASLGWLLQLDGDDLRNAFLNAPWVRAVIPIRPGKNKAALNWLKQVEGMNGIGPNDMYKGNEVEFKGKTLLKALEILAGKVNDKQAASNRTGRYPPEETDDDNKVSATPIDKVFEYGFYPLKGGFRAIPTASDPQHPDGSFEVFDQWLEVVPTDQIAAVEVRYDPKTGRQQ